jgi:hypothetical protein
MATTCFCNSSGNHGENEPCPFGPVRFSASRPDLSLIQEQIDRGFVHIMLDEGPAHVRIQAGLASKRARTTWIIAFNVKVPGRPLVQLTRKIHKRKVEDEVLDLVFDARRFNPQVKIVLS